VASIRFSKSAIPKNKCSFRSLTNRQDHGADVLQYMPLSNSSINITSPKWLLSTSSLFRRIEPRCEFDFEIAHKLRQCYNTWSEKSILRNCYKCFALAFGRLGRPSQPRCLAPRVARPRPIYAKFNILVNVRHERSLDWAGGHLHRSRPTTQPNEKEQKPRLYRKGNPRKKNGKRQRARPRGSKNGNE